MWDHWLIIVVVEGSDEEMDKLAEEEEEEALALQKHMAASLEEQDFDAADFEVWQFSILYMNQGVFIENIQAWAFYLPWWLAGMNVSQILFSLIAQDYFNSWTMLLIVIIY